MLRRSIVRRHQPLINLYRQTYAYYHVTNSVYSQPKQVEEESPLNKLSQGISAFTSTLLNAPPLRRVTKPNIETLPFTGNATSWEQAIREAQSLVNSADQERIFDPVKVVGKDLWELKGNITKLLGSGHPFIDTIGKHYFESDTNRIRPLLVLLIAKASSVADKDPSRVVPDGPISDTQRRLAEITEMIYTASLLHYDVIDNNEASNAVFGNKMAVLAGDFLLARSSVALAQLKNAECIELMATCIAHLVEGEFMQLQKPKEDMDKNKAFEYYLKQVYLKTSSLIAESCKASSVLAGCTSHVVKAAYDYGNNFGIAFQLLNDVRQFTQIAAHTSTSSPTAWINAPVLMAWTKCPDLGSIIERKFSREGDMEKARLLVYQTNAFKDVMTLADEHIKKAIDSIDHLPTSDARSALVQLVKNLPSRQE
ncbi:coq1 putative hexaprenyl diphosphate synthase [Rhizopus azygosporus]|uniref:Coq1 putative hexaprenyl diphosphate synthase n=1 Tax=Rhizopus azygosporus TaxID=86630 RepID=A0A367JW40_RHIAZ|nr:coq1 putative hexaprenyl diphosphate synthase [Rhizopus azygosporus]